MDWQTAAGLAIGGFSGLLLCCLLAFTCVYCRRSRLPDDSPSVSPSPLRSPFRFRRLRAPLFSPRAQGSSGSPLGAIRRKLAPVQKLEPPAEQDPAAAIPAGDVPLAEGSVRPAPAGESCLSATLPVGEQSKSPRSPADLPPLPDGRRRRLSTRHPPPPPLLTSSPPEPRLAGSLSFSMSRRMSSSVLQASRSRRPRARTQHARPPPAVTQEEAAAVLDTLDL